MRVGGYEGSLTPRKHYSTIEWTCSKLNWNECIGKVTIKAEIVEELKMKINKKFIFDVFFEPDFHKISRKG